MAVTTLKKVPMRKCVATQERFPKKELIRIVRSPEGQILIDETGKANGRGAYLNKSVDAVNLARKTGALSKALEADIPEEIYAKLTEMFRG